MSVSTYQLRKAAIKVTDCMLFLMFEMCKNSLSFNPQLPIYLVIQKCRDYDTCVCLPHLCMYSYCRLQRKTFDLVYRVLDVLPLPVCFTGDSNRSGLLNPLYRALFNSNYSEEYINECLGNLDIKVVVDKNARELAYYSRTQYVYSMPVCAESCLCCSNIVR